MYKYKPKDYALGVQHLLAMFGSTVLVPLITGLSPSVALFTAGIGTLLFHLCTKGIVPVFLGSSFAFIPALCTIIGEDHTGIQAAQFGIMAAGAVYLVFSLLAKVLGADALRKLFPPVVTGPVIIIIGLSLTSVGIHDAMGLLPTDSFVINASTMHNLIIALFTFAIVAIGMNSRFKLWRMIPILFGIIFGYLLCVILHVTGLFKMDFSPIVNAPWINIPYRNGFFTLPKVNWQAVFVIAPIAIVTFMEHIGDITTNGAVVGKDFFKEPGLHRTLLGDGLATMIAGFFGGPCNTTYSENTGVLASTGNYNPALLRLAAVFAMFLGLLGKFGAVLQTIPQPVKGGVEIVLFGMIASIGIRTIGEAKLNLADTRNLSIMGATLCCGIGLGGGVPLVIHGVTVNISALFVATVVGVIMNLVLPKSMNPLAAAEKDNEPNEITKGK
ncbi:MAG: uracil-xanthine permease family protein [Lentisphaeria bacterium]|nr:uracil-xanthine permease [Victivallales bacterium]MCR4572788.1 uracil-xanthine permease family protein [Lentisphaeria bacterium]